MRIYYLLTIFILTTWLSACENSNNETTQLNDKVRSRSLLDNLKTDTLIINVQNDGCEPMLSEEIKLFKVNDSLNAELAFISNDKRILKRLLHTMTNDAIAAYEKFETYGKNFKNEGPSSTLNTSYKITLQADTIEFSDDRQQFDGYRKLINEIFGEQNIENSRKKIYH
jgi:hypothetical protein